MIKDFVIISSLIIIHECGHFFCAKLIGFQTDKIYLYPLGGISKFHMPISTERKKEFLVLIMGPIFQNVAYVLLMILLKEKELITNYHIGILCFNLLPIVPLDGGKILNILTSSIVPYQLALKISVIISYLATIILLLIQKKISINMILMYVILIILIRKEEGKEKRLFDQFLLERYLHKYHFKKDILIQKEKDFYRYKNNKIKSCGTILSEEEYLQKKYNNFDKNC